ncbi:MAG: late competence development ComFB family protein [Bacillota bacterium]|nr:late competence development ComFB family protein [Bacillota bacterium]
MNHIIENNKEKFQLKNYTEELVKAALDDMIPRIKCCTCERCKQDIIAYALNHLPAKYAVTLEGEMYSKINELVQQSVVDIQVVILEAVDIVSKKPRH